MTEFIALKLYSYLTVNNDKKSKDTKKRRKKSP